MKKTPKINTGVPLMAGCAFCLSLGQLFWKISVGRDFASAAVYIAAGFAIYGAGFICMIKAYTYGELSVLQPLNSLSYVFALVFGLAFLHEQVSVYHLAGVAVIIAGTILLAAPAPRSAKSAQKGSP